MSIASMLYLALLLIGITLLVIYSRSGRLLKSILFTLATGFIAFAIVLLAARFTDLPISITPLSVMISGLLGVPGVIGMLILNLI